MTTPVVATGRAKTGTHRIGSDIRFGERGGPSAFTCECGLFLEALTPEEVDTAYRVHRQAVNLPAAPMYGGGRGLGPVGATPFGGRVLP